MPDIFGDFKDDGYVIEAVEAMLKARLAHYVAKVEAAAGLEPQELPLIKTWANENQFETVPDNHQLPMVLTIVPEIYEEPTMNGQGVYSAKWTTGVAVVVSAGRNSQKLAKLYGSAVRLCMVQNSSLLGRAKGLRWLGSRYDDIPTEDTRSVGASQHLFWIEVDGVADTRKGPTDFSTDPYAGVPNPVTIETVDSTIRLPGDPD